MEARTHQMSSNCLTIKPRRGVDAATGTLVEEQREETLELSSKAKTTQVAADLLLHQQLSNCEVIQWRLCGLR